MKYWCAANSNLAYFIELTTTLECQKQLLMSSISNLGGRESRETAVILRNRCNLNIVMVVIITYTHLIEMYLHG